MRKSIDWPLIGALIVWVIICATIATLFTGCLDRSKATWLGLDPTKASCEHSTGPGTFKCITPERVYMCIWDGPTATVTCAPWPETAK